MSDIQIDATTLTQCYIEARRMAYAWLQGAGPDNKSAMRQYDARLDALQDMMDVIEQRTGMTLERDTDECVDVDIDEHDHTPIPSFTEQIVAPIKQRMKNEDNES